MGKSIPFPRKINHLRRCTDKSIEMEGIFHRRNILDVFEFLMTQLLYIIIYK